MNILQIIAHRSPKSFTSSLAEEFARGASLYGNSVETMNLYDNWPQYILKQKIKEADQLSFAWPLYFELPPAPLVELFQTVFVEGFAFEMIEGRKVNLFDTTVTCLVSMGQKKEYNTTNLREAMEYCGLKPHFFVFAGVGPYLTEEKASQYLDLAHYAGTCLRTK